MMMLCCSERSERAIRHAGDIDLIVLDLKKRYHSYRADSGHHEDQDEIIIAQHMNCADANPGADAGMYDSLRSIHALNMDTSAS